MRRRTTVSLAAWLCALLVGAPLVAQSGAEEPEEPTLQLSDPVLRLLSQLQDEWLVWNSAFLQGDRDTASGAVDNMLATAGQLGFSRIADLQHGMVLSAVEAAREGSFEKAEWALQMAERLDADRPETAFARARVAWLDGNRGGAVAAHLSGFWKTFADPRLRRVLVFNTQIWVLVSLMLTAAGFVALQMASKGPHLYREVVNWLGRLMPRALALVIAGAFLLWPFLVPRGWIWVALFWAALLWGYGSSSERWAMAFALLVLGCAPILIRVQQPSLQMALAPEQKAIDGLSAGRLYGTIFEDLGRLRDRLPGNVPAAHLLGDVHVMLGQRDLARPRYSEVTDAEPDNGDALNNLGIFHMLRDEYARAIPFFEQAAELPSSQLAASYNLSQIYSEMLEISNSERFLAQARGVDAERVSTWIAEQQQFVSLDGGFARLSEIQSELRRLVAPRSSDLLRRWQSWGRSLLLAIAAMLIGVLLQFFRSRSGTWMGLQGESGSWVARSLRWLVPGYISAEAGDGGRSFVALLIPVSALFLPFAGLLGYRVPWTYDPGQQLAWTFALLGLGLFYVARFVTR